MLYGINTRDRSPTADKRRYQPWSGSAMNGLLELEIPQGDITITRRTTRSNSPMGTFSAVYTGSSAPFAQLTAASCGETLLGVPQDVFERSAFIRQSGLAVNQSAALERRIASLITTGEEDTSFTDAAERLKKQLNARRHNKTGRLPELERDAQALRAALEEMDQLSASVARDQQELEAVQGRLRELGDLLARHDLADQADAARVVESARLDAASARDRLKTLESASRALPDRLELEAIQGRMDALSTVGHATAESRARMEAAARVLRSTQEALDAHPLAGKSPSEIASVSPDFSKRPKFTPLLPILALLAGLLLAGLVGWLTSLWPAAVGAGLAFFGLALLGAALPLRRRQEAWDRDQEEVLQRHREALDEYTALYDKAAEARNAYQGAQAAYEAVAAGAQANLEQVLHQVRAFRPMVRDLDEARLALDSAFTRCGELEQARRKEEAARLRWEARRADAPPPPPEPVERPAASREQIRLQMADAQALLAAVSQRLHTTQGRMQALGDPADLRMQLQRLEERRAELQREYDAIAMAMEVLFVASSSLQTRFSPDLGQRTASIFTKLTKGKYNKVLLDQELHPSAQEEGAFVSHEAAFLSQGAADQLYLAVRLAICDMVLPRDRAVPIILDDALVNFDDERMAAALDYLLEASGRRQVLLFTCQRREADYLQWAYPGRFHRIHL